MKKILKAFIFTILLVLGSVIFIGNVPNVEIADATTFTAEQIQATAPPSSFDLRNVIDINVEDQGNYGICWAYASLTSLETYLALNYGEYYDFSELHLAVSAYLQDGYYSSLYQALKFGGNFENLFTYVQKAKNLVLEEEFSISNYASPTSQSSKVISDYNEINSNYYSIAKVNDTNKFASYYGDKSGKNLTQYRNGIKNHIMTYGSITSAIMVQDSNWTSNYDLCVQDSTILQNPPSSVTQSVNHLVSIIGWDDNYDSMGEWSEKGAYLCLNSWGSKWGKSGCFYISYNDYLVEYCLQGINSASLYNNSDQLNLYNEYPENTFTQQHTFISSSTLNIAQVLDVSGYQGQTVENIDIFIKGNQTSFCIRFFSTKEEALSSLNYVTSAYNTNLSLLGEYGLYDKYRPASTLTISNKFMVIVSEIVNPTVSSSIASRTTEIEQNCFVKSLTTFSTTWDSFLSSDGQSCHYTLPIRILFSGNSAVVSNFVGDADSIIHRTLNSGEKQYVKNNATFLNKTLNCTISNTSVNIKNVTVNKLYKNSHVDVTSNFTVSYSGNKFYMTLSSKVPTGNYVITIPTSSGNIYRVIEVQDVATYLINYHLDGGTASNPRYFTKDQTSLNLTPPTKAGYTFMGWYVDADFKTKFTSLPKSNLDLYAKYDFSTPTILTKTNNIDCVYSKGLSIEVKITAEHALENSFNTITYQWYKKGFGDTNFTILSGQTSNSIVIQNAVDSGYYACEVSIIIADTSLVAEPCTRSIPIGEVNTISVKIDKFIYDMSKAVWDYTEKFSYDTQAHTVRVINLPDGVSVNYTNNSASNINSYTAKAELVYDDMSGNAYAEPIADLNWEIRKAKITITIQNVISEDELELSVLKSRFNCKLDHEYMPSELTTLAQKLEYLGFKYIGPIDTKQPTIKTISGQTSSFEIYDITIIDGVYRYVAKSLADTNNSGIIAFNKDGFTADCTFEVKTIGTLDDNTQRLLSSNHLSLIRGYHLKFSYLREEDKYVVTLPIERNDLLAKLHIFIVKDGKLERVNQTDITTSGLTIEASELDNQFLIVEADTGHTSNTQKMAIILIACGFIILYVCIIVEFIRKKRKFI